MKQVDSPPVECRKTVILLDTNILLLYFVGRFKKEEVPRFKRTRMFALEDYDTLTRVLVSFKQVITTPNILTEVSNHLGYMDDHLRPGQFEVFAHGIKLLDERFAPSSKIACTSEFKRFGLTDAAIFHLCQTNCAVLTDDWALYNYLQKQGVCALNFNHIRLQYWR